jgi:hypothetical protein
VLAEVRWWFKAILLCCVVPVVAFSFVYPSMFIEFAFAAVVLIAMVRPALLRSRPNLAAVAIACLFTGTLLYLYYQDILPIMRNTWYPAKRIGPPGTVPVIAALSQIFPFLSFSLSDYRHFVGDNICEIASVGSFLPLLTFCCLGSLTRRLRNALIVLAGGLGLITLWQIAPAPRWIGHLLRWDHAAAGRLLFISGFLLTFGCLLAWREQALSASRRRIAIFLLVGPIGSVILKASLFRLYLASCTYDIALSVLIVVAGVVAILVPGAMRLPVLLAAITLVNVGGFARYNPIQSADPIFNVPDTDMVHRLAQKQEGTPGHFLVVGNFFGASLNGMGFRSVSHVLQTPQPKFFRQFFPHMDAARFDFIFNRYSNLLVTEYPFPRIIENYITYLPREAFEPVLNVRRAVVDADRHKNCSLPRGGAVENVTEQPDRLILEGWASWKSEDSTQELHILASTPVRVLHLSTVKRTDIAESKLDYGYARSGFKLELTGAGGHPPKTKDVVLIAHATSDGTVLLGGCGCP